MCMKILMTVTQNSLLDGINRHILAVASELNKLCDVEVAVCTVFKRGELHLALEKQGVKTFALDAPHGHSFRIIQKFANVMREFRPDIIHIHGLAFCERLYLWFSRNKCKLVVTRHGIGSQSVLDNLICCLFPLSILGEIYVSQGVMEYYLGASLNTKGAHVSIIYNPVNIDIEVGCKRKDFRAELGLPESAKIIGTACRIAAIKQPQCFIRVMAKVLLANPHATAVILGDGPSEMVRLMNETIKETGIGDRIRFLGYRADAASLVAAFDVFVMTSRSEGMPTAVLEAMSHGVPIAFWNGNGGLKDLYEINRIEQFGVSTSNGDIEGLALGISTLLTDENQHAKCAASARQICREKFSSQYIAKQLFKFYTSLAS